MQDLRGKVAVVTGGASGIGYAMAERFAREGAKVVLADIEAGALERAARALREAGAEVLPVQTDVSKRASVEQLLERTLQAHERVHILCNNAGVYVCAPAWETTPGQWEWILGVNLWGVIHGVSVFVPRMIEQGDECHIVNTASMAGLLSVPMMSAYQVTKHGVVTLSESLAIELAERQPQIGVSVLCPAFVQSNLHEAERNRPADLFDASPMSEAARARLKQSVTELIAAGKPASVIAEATVRAIRERQLHVITHAEAMPAFRERVDRILDA